MSLYHSVVTFLTQTQLSPLKPRISLGHHMIAKMQDDRLVFGSQVHSPYHTNGYDFHLSVHRDDLPRAFDIVTDIMEKHKGGCFKVVTPFQATVIGVPEPLRNSDDEDGLSAQRGEVFTLPHTLFNDGTAVAPRKDMIEILREIEEAFEKENIRPGPQVLKDTPLRGKGYTSFRWVGKVPQPPANGQPITIEHEPKEHPYKGVTLSFPDIAFLRSFESQEKNGQVVFRLRRSLNDEEATRYGAALRSFGIELRVDGNGYAIASYGDSTDRFAQLLTLAGKSHADAVTNRRAADGGYGIPTGR